MIPPEPVPESSDSQNRLEAFLERSTLATIGYIRVSREDQRPDLQRDALETAGCPPLFGDTAHVHFEQPGTLRVRSLIIRSTHENQL